MKNFIILLIKSIKCLVDSGIKNKLFKSTVNPLAIDLIDKLLLYAPEKRLKACEALAHPYFDDLRKETFRIDNKKLTLNLFDFTLGKISSKS